MKHVLHNISKILISLWLVASCGIYAQVSSYPYNEDFENGANGWIAGSLLSNPMGSWALGDPSGKAVLHHAHSGVNCWTTNLLGNTTTGERSFLESPDFDFSNLLLPKLSLWMQHSLADSQCGANIWYTTNNGTKWYLVGSEQDPDWYSLNHIPQAPGYPAPMSASPIAVPGFTKDPSRNNGWYNVSKVLGNLGGQASVKFRIYYSDYDTSGGAVSFPQEGFNIDDITIEETFSFSLGLPDTITVCPGMAIDMKVSNAGGLVQWSTGHVGDSIVTNKAGWVRCSLVAGTITYRDSVCIIHQAPQLRGGVIQEFSAARRKDSVFSCTNQQPYLYFFPNPAIQHHTWIAPTGQSSDSTRISLSQKGMYRLQQTDYLSCMVEDSIQMVPVIPTLLTLPNEVNHCDSVDVSVTLGPHHASTLYPVWYTQQGTLSDTLPVKASYRFGEPGTLIFSVIDGLNLCHVHDTTEVYIGPIQTSVFVSPEYGNNEGYAYIENGPNWKGTAPVSYNWDNTGYVPDDTLKYLSQGNYTVWIQDVLGCKDTADFTITHDIAVFPGDTDRDGIVGMMDLFPIGMYYNRTGPPRPNASFSWTPQPGPAWNVNISSGNDLQHVDVSGNGTVNDADTFGIFQNYSFVHTNKKSSGAPAISFRMPDTVNTGDTLRIPVLIGDPNMTVKNTYGLAFSIMYDTAMVVENSVRLDFSGSWLGVKGQDLITMGLDFFDKGRVDIGMVRNDLIRRAGYGRLCDVIVVIDDHIGKRNLPFRLDFSDIHAIDSDGRVVDLDGTPGVTMPTTGISPSWESSIQLYPNPTNSIAYLSHVGLGKGSVDVFDIGGKKMISKDLHATGLTPIDLEEYPPGIYMILIRGKGGEVYQKIMRRP